MERTAEAGPLRRLGPRRPGGSSAGCADLDDAGPAIRVHGDFHLGQVMRTDAGWYVLDFGGEPARPLEERRQPSSPLKDVAGMLRSLHYAAGGGHGHPGGGRHRPGPGLGARNRAVLPGRLPGPGHRRRPPARGPAARSAVLAAFELDKAVYEVAYEQAHRPDWVEIPTRAVARLVENA